MPSTPPPRAVRVGVALCLAAACTALPAWAGRELPPTKNRDELPPLEELPLLAAATENSNAAMIAQASEPSLTASEPTITGRPTPSQNVTINLINRLVERGVLPKEDAELLIQQAETDTANAREQAAATQSAAMQAGQLAQAAAQAAAQATPDPLQEGTVRVTYIPEIVKAQMRDEIRAEVLAQARAENWAAPNAVPEWVQRFRAGGDIRVRFQTDTFPDGNDNTGSFPNFNAINTGAPFDIAGTNFSPQLNVDQDRERIRLRARIGADILLGDGFSGGIRIATGESNSPTSTNQSLGLAGSGQGGNFSKYAIWLDRGFLKYELGAQPSKALAVSVGRFDNPFFGVSEVIFDDDLGFDGFAAQGRYEVLKGFTPFAAIGAFPIFNTDFNFSSNRPDKFDSDDKWLYGGQSGVSWRINKDFTLKTAAAYYHFDNVRGALSDPYVPLSASDAGNTDATRPSFAQKGNTYRPLRNILPTADNNFGTTNQFQYFGLATGFRNLVLAAKLDYNRYEPFQISAFGEYAKNLAFDSDNIDRVAINNRGPNEALGTIGRFEGGDTAWIAGLRVGRAALEKFGDWNVGASYRYVESDAVIDGLVDSDFGGGGTNLRGYTVAGAFSLGQRVALGMRWMSANEVAGPQFKTDIFQFDINGKF